MFAHLKRFTIFMRGDSKFQKISKRHAICLESGYDFDRVGKLYRFGESVPVNPV